jgi:hypothetical protein
MIPFIVASTLADILKESAREIVYFSKSMWFGQDNEFED